MTETTTDTTEAELTEEGSENPHARPGELFCWYVTGVIWRSQPAAMFGSGSQVSQRGETVEITAAMLEASPWISRYLGDETAQVERWGEVRIRPGAFPVHVSRFRQGDPDWEEAREMARQRAWAIADPEERAAARAEVERVYGPAPQTSQTVEIREHHTVKAAREQAERRAHGGVDRRH